MEREHVGAKEEFPDSFTTAQFQTVCGPHVSEAEPQPKTTWSILGLVGLLFDPPE